MTWVDATSYQRGERGNVVPSTWERVSGPLRVVVTRRHGMAGWYGFCDAVGARCVPLDDDLEVAKVQAVGLVVAAVEAFAKHAALLARKEPHA